jgi:phosphogluconate dehydratase
MSGASGKVPAAIHVCPEAVDGGAIARLRDGDILRVDAEEGVLDILTEGVLDRDAAVVDLSGNNYGTGRELFANFRQNVGGADTGASIFGV